MNLSIRESCALSFALQEMQKASKAHLIADTHFNRDARELSLMLTEAGKSSRMQAEWTATIYKAGGQYSHKKVCALSIWDHGFKNSQQHYFDDDGNHWQ